MAMRRADSANARIDYIDYDIIERYVYNGYEIVVPLPKEEPKPMDYINPSTVLLFLGDAVQCIEVAYEDNGRGHNLLKKTTLTDLKVGDFVTVETSTRYGAAVCKVVRLNVPISPTSTETIDWAFSKVNMEELDRLKGEELKAVQIIMDADRKKKARELRELLQKECGEELKALTTYKEA